jgi:hypothetical protein
MTLRVVMNVPDEAASPSTDAYPTLPADFSFEPASDREIFMTPGERRLGTVRWVSADNPPSTFDITHFSAQGHERWLLPAAPGSDKSFVPLTAWWVLLFGLSIFARYDPGLWGEALNLDRSGHAVPLQLLLDEALQELPVLVANALRSPLNSTQ